MFVVMCIYIYIYIYIYVYVYVYISSYPGYGYVHACMDGLCMHV